MNKMIIALILLLFLGLSSYASFADDLEDAGVGPLTPKEAMFVPADPGDKGGESVTAEDSGLSSEISGDAAYSEAGAESVDSAMDVGMDY